MNEEIITIDEMCEILNIGKNTAYRLLANQEIQAFKIGRLWKIPKSSIVTYIQKAIVPHEEEKPWLLIMAQNTYNTTTRVLDHNDQALLFIIIILSNQTNTSI